MKTEKIIYSADNLTVAERVPPRKQKRMKKRAVEITLIDRMTIYVDSHSRKHARNKVTTVAELNAYKKNGGYVLHNYRNIARYHLPLGMGE